MTSEINGRGAWPVFLIGCHRSGTTLLRFFLDSHENLACPPESKFLGGLEALMDYPQAMQGLQSLGYSRKAVLAELRKPVEAFLGGYAQQCGKRRWVDKTPNYYRLLPFIDELFEGRVLYLFIVRHPLDCVASLESVWNVSAHHPDPDLARAVRDHGKGRLTWARYWNDVNEHILVFSQAHTQRCHTIRYEDLVHGPEAALRGICEFLGESFSDELIRKAFSEPHTSGLEDPKIRKTAGIVSDRMGMWRTWPAREAAALWRTVQSNAEEFGYSLSPEQRPTVQETADAASPTQHPAIAAPVAIPARSSHPDSPKADRFRQQLEDLIEDCERRLDQQPAVLDYHSGLDLAQAFPQHSIFSPPPGEGPLPYLDNSIDIVVANGERWQTEALRVAKVAVAVVRDGDSRLAVEWKSADTTRSSSVASIIVSCGGNLAKMDRFLRNLLESLPADFQGELILTADADAVNSTGGIEQWRSHDARIRVVPIGARPHGISKEGRNRGAQTAVGEILVFLDTDMLPQPGWLPPLLRTFRRFPRAGAVGGRLTYADGALQEAGGLVFTDGTTARYGDGDREIDAPLYQYVREVDFCSLALFATRGALFREVGGFVVSPVPADVDYCFQLRERGYATYYQPESVAVQQAGGTETDLAKNQINPKEFIERWRHILRQQPERPAGLNRKTLLQLSTGGGSQVSAV